MKQFKFMVCCALISLSSPLYASIYGFYAGLTGMYMLPSETELGTFLESWQYSSNNTISAVSKPANPQYTGAGAITLGYDLGQTNNNLEFNYLYLRSNTNASNTQSNNLSSFATVFFLFTEPLTILPGDKLITNNNLEYQFNQFDLSIGHHYNDALNHLQFHPLIGIRYSNLQHNLSGTVQDSSAISTGTVKSNYHGIGPMLGIDGQFDFGCGFGAAGYFDTSLLMGVVSSTSVLFYESAIYNFHSPSTNRVVSTTDIKVGANYSYRFSQSSAIKLELGYQIVKYANVFDLIHAEAPPAARILGIETNSFSFAGPYLTLALI